MEIDKLIDKGGKHWQGSGGKNRIYFNADTVMDHAGFIVSKDVTGTKIRTAQIRGEQISNAVGKHLQFAFKDKKFKLYYDLTLQAWKYTFPDCGIAVERHLTISVNAFIAYVEGDAGWGNEI